MTIHVGILDQDPVRLITGLLHRKIRAEKLILIGVENQQSQFEKITTVLTLKGIATEFFIIPCDINVPIIKQNIAALADKLSMGKTPVFFNASCGLRHRLLSAYEIFRSKDWPIYVIEPFSDELCWLYPEKMAQDQLQEHITICDCLTIFGARCELPQDKERDNFIHAIEILGSKWASHAYELGTGLATLNYLATTCRKAHCLQVELNEKQQSYNELGMLIDDLQGAGLAHYHAGVLRFQNETARRFANGEWLEWYVHYVVMQLRQQLDTIQDIALGVQVYRRIGAKEVRNELDVATIVNNRLHIIECKTKGMTSDGDDTLYKLESVRDLLGGIQARAMLVSFRPLRHHDVTRATDLGLALIGPDELADLKTHLYQWFSGAGAHIPKRLL